MGLKIEIVAELPAAQKAALSADSFRFGFLVPGQYVPLIIPTVGPWIFQDRADFDSLGAIRWEYFGSGGVIKREGNCAPETAWHRQIVNSWSTAGVGGLISARCAILELREWRFEICS